MTRERILSAARRLFRAHGYGRTSIEDIARSARVAPATVYLAFGSKKSIVLALAASVGAIPEAEALNTRILAEPTLARRLEITAMITRLITESAWDLMTMARAGAALDPDLAAAWRRGTEGRHDAVARALHEVVDQARVDAATAVDIVWALTGPELYGALVVDRGWSPDRYEDFLAELLLAALVRGISGPRAVARASIGRRSRTRRA